MIEVSNERQSLKQQQDRKLLDSVLINVYLSPLLMVRSSSKSENATASSLNTL